MVISGAVEVLLATDDGLRLPLARLTRGATFGEMSLLTKEPISAEVAAKGQATILEYPAERFQAALAECAPLRNHILVSLCGNLRRTSLEAWRFYQRETAHRALEHIPDRAGAIVAESANMRRVRDKIGELAS